MLTGQAVKPNRANFKIRQKKKEFKIEWDQRRGWFKETKQEKLLFCAARFVWYLRYAHFKQTFFFELLRQDLKIWTGSQNKRYSNKVAI